MDLVTNLLKTESKSSSLKSKSKSSKNGLKSRLESKSGLEYYKSAMCITTKPCHVMSQQKNQSAEVLAEHGDFWSKPSAKSCDKTTWEVVSDLMTLYEDSDLEPTRSLFQSEWSYEKIRGTFITKGGRCPQRLTSMMVNGDCSTSPLYQHLAYRTGWQRSKWWSTSQHLTDGWSLLKTEVYEVVRAQLHAFAQLQSLD